MFLTVHATAGALIGHHFKNPILAFVLAFVSHFILDVVPHGDQGWIDEYKDKSNRAKIKKIISITVVDASVLLALLMSKFYFQNLTPTLSIAAGIIGGILPDFIVGCHELSENLFRKFHRLHFVVHDTIKFQPSMVNGIIFQVIILGFMFYYI